MRELTDGSTAIVRGALEAGCSFFAGYPITPASPILMSMLDALPKAGGVAIQGEDEIASIGMCVGAAMTGARAMTATSGPGISLYSETVGLAVMGEVPLVIVDVQRLGPGTGGATTVSQGDVQFVRWGTAGGYPVIVLAPSTVPEHRRLTRRAFALAERFRCPVFLLTDKELALTLTTVEVEDGPLPGPQGPVGMPAVGPRMYQYEPADGVRPIVVYGHGGAPPVRFTGSTHDEQALITKDPVTVGALNRHLVEKIEAHRDEIEMADADVETGADRKGGTLWISYGVTAGAMREAVVRARTRTRTRRSGERVSALTVHSLWPVPETALLDTVVAAGADRVVVAELNHGLYRREVERVLGRLHNGVAVEGLHRIDGELLSPEQFLETLP